MSSAGAFSERLAHRHFALARLAHRRSGHFRLNSAWAAIANGQYRPCVGHQVRVPDCNTSHHPDSMQGYTISSLLSWLSANRSGTAGGFDYLPIVYCFHCGILPYRLFPSPNLSLIRFTSAILPVLRPGVRFPVRSSSSLPAASHHHAP